MPLGLGYLIDAFLTLSSDRTNAPIPFSSIIAYANFMNLSNQKQFLRIIQRMDATYINLTNKLQSRDTSKVNKRLQERNKQFGV